MRPRPFQILAFWPLLFLPGCSHNSTSSSSATASAPSAHVTFLPADSPGTQALLDNLSNTRIPLFNVTGMRLDMAVLLLNSQYPQKISADWRSLQLAGLPPSAPVTLHAENRTELELLGALFDTTSAQHPPLKISSQADTLQIAFPPPDRAMP